MHSRADVRGYPGSYGLLSEDSSATTAIIFVHGFAGNAVTTWVNFQSLIDAPSVSATFAKCDLFFYAYDSTGTSVVDSAIRLGHFVENVGLGVSPSTFRYWFPTDGRGIAATPVTVLYALSRKYSKLVFVAHSLGGVIVRRTILDSVDRERPFGDEISERLNSSKVVLFAPAHRGFRHDLVANMLISASRLLQLGAAVWVLTRGAVYPDVVQSSGTLKDLEDNTAAAHKNAAHSGLTAEIYWGLPDAIVIVGKYQQDHQTKKSNLDHVLICKPGNRFTDPVKWVARALE